MLLLERNLHETIEIGDGIVITVCRIRGGKVLIGIAAPQDVKVWRGEIAEARRRGESASKPGDCCDAEDGS